MSAWNAWRIDNPEVRPDLSGANLRRANLSGVDFSRAMLIGADLSQADLTGAFLVGAGFSGADFSRADLSGANLTGAVLTGAFLSEADLSGANLTGANINRANLIEAVLKEADLTRANLIKADLRAADLNWAVLRWASLSDAVFRWANLTDADLKQTQLMRADFTGANLTKADLTGANLIDADFSEADLSWASLSTTQALETNFDRAILTGVCLQEWHTNSATNLNDVVCNYVYLRHGQKERRPSSGNFALGEFAKLFQKALETVDLVFHNGIDWDIFAYSLRKVEVENQGVQLDVQSIEKKGDGVLVVRVSVSPDKDKAKIHSDFVQGYEFASRALEAQHHARVNDKDNEINRLFYLVNQLNEKLGEVPKLMAENPKINMSFHGPVGNAAGEVQGDQKNIQHNYALEKKQTLAEAAAEIRRLLEQLSQTYPISTNAERLTVAAKVADEIKSNPTLKARVVSALKLGGTEAFKQAIDHPLVNVLMATLEGWKEAE